MSQGKLGVPAALGLNRDPAPRVAAGATKEKMSLWQSSRVSSLIPRKIARAVQRVDILHFRPNIRQVFISYFVTLEVNLADYLLGIQEY